MGDLERSGAAASDARLLALKVAYLERVNAGLRERLRRIEQIAYMHQAESGVVVNVEGVADPEKTAETIVAKLGDADG